MSRSKAFGLPGLLVLLFLLPALAASAAPLDPIYPADGAEDIAEGLLTLRWEGDPGALSYRLSFGVSAATMSPVSLPDSTSPMADVTVERDRTYYWQASAVSGDVVTTSNVWSFSTRAAAAPQIGKVYPTGEADEKVPFGAATLQWTVRDDAGRDLTGFTFDVYLGESGATLNRVAEGLRQPLCDVALGSARKYFWYVQARDGDGNITLSPIWTFLTTYDDSLSGGCSQSVLPSGALLLPLLLLLRR